LPPGLFSQTLGQSQGGSVTGWPPKEKPFPAASDAVALPDAGFGYANAAFPREQDSSALIAR